MHFRLNLATRNYVNRTWLYSLYALLTVILIGILLLNSTLLMRSRAQGKVLEARLVELRGDVTAAAGKAVDPQLVQRLNGQIVFANQLLERDHYRWTLLLDQLEGVVVDGIGITSLQPDYQGNTLKLTGRARNVVVLRTFLDRLAASPDFSRVYLLQQSLVADGGDELVFSLNLTRGRNG